MGIFIYAVYFVLSWVILHHFLSLLYRKYRRFPPGPMPLPIIGNLLNLGYKPHISLANLAKVHGPVMCLKLGSLTTIVISSPSSAKEVMQKNDATFANVRFVPDALRACNYSEMSIVFCPVDGMGRTLRKIANSVIFSTSRLEARSDLRKQKVNDLLSHVDACCRTGVAVHIAQAVFNTALNLMSCIFFGEDLIKHMTLEGSDEIISSSDGHSNNVDVGNLKDMIVQLAVESGKPNICDFFPYFKWLDPQGRRKILEVHFGKIMVLFNGLLDKRSKDGIGSGGDDDALDALLKMSNNDSEGFDRRFIPYMLMDLFMGATDTNASTMEWAITELLCNPTKMKKAQNELEETIGRSNLVTEADISKLPYLQAVIKETMRLHPPAPLLLPRKASSDAIVSGFLVPKNAQVLVNVWAIQRDPNVWEDANLFKPERFLGSNIDIRGQDFELTPFGSGRRICPGMPLAIKFLHLLLGSLIHSYDWNLEDGVTPETLDMEEIFGMSLHKAQSLKAIPLYKS